LGGIPFGKHTESYGKSLFLIGIGAYWGHFKNSEPLNYQMVISKLGCLLNLRDGDRKREREADNTK
jgi:hypothetical protein